MSKPEDIPQDVWDKAAQPSTRVQLDVVAGQIWDIRPTIARAIMSAKAEEREACAVAATEQTKAPAQRSVKDRWVEQIGQSIAAAIRKMAPTP